MSFQKLKTNSFCYGGKHGSATKNSHGNITFKGKKVLIGHCSICSRKKSKTVSDNTVLAEGLGDFFKNLAKKDI